MIINVSSTVQLQAALASAKGGDTISLAAGNYGTVNIVGRNYSSAITIKSSVGMAAHFDGLFVDKSSFINLESLDLGRPLKTGEPDYTKLATVQNSNNIKMTGVSIHGSLDGNSANDGYGLFLRNVNGFKLMDSNVREVNRGVLAERSYNVEISSTHFNEMRSDGINIAGVVGVTLDGNTFTNFRPVGSDHADAIQFWNVGQPFGSKDIVIKNNVVMNGSGFGPQGIFMNAANGWDYSNVLIQNNMIYSNDSYHGIHVEGARDVRIIGNTALSHQVDRDYMWVNVANIDGLNLSNNVAEHLIIGPGVTGISQSNNQTLRANPLLKALIPNLDHAKVPTDLIVPNAGYQVPIGSGGNPPAPPAPPPPDNEASIPLFGTDKSWETMWGTSANEIIFGVSESGGTIGRGTHDKIYGGGGSDIFALADQRGLFYDDNISTNGGWSDHVSILDFDANDKIQLLGQASDYVLRPSTFNGIYGTSIFRDDDQDGKAGRYDELIAHVAGSEAANTLHVGNLIFVQRIQTVLVNDVETITNDPGEMMFMHGWLSLQSMPSGLTLDSFTALP